MMVVVFSAFSACFCLFVVAECSSGKQQQKQQKTTTRVDAHTRITLPLFEM